MLDPKNRKHIVNFVVDELFSKYDGDGNDVLDFNEFRPFINRFYPAHKKFTADEARILFKTVDINNDGSIQKQEMVQFIYKLLDDEALENRGKQG